MLSQLCHLNPVLQGPKGNDMLTPYRVLDLTDEKGEFAGMLLGDLGADVIKIEPPEGSQSRTMGPFLDGVSEPEGSLGFSLLTAINEALL